MEPSPAPAHKAGAKTPPAAPEVKESSGPNILNKETSQLVYFWFVNKILAIKSFPEPKVLTLTNTASITRITAETIRYTMCLYVFLKVFFQRNNLSIAFERTLPIIPVSTAIPRTGIKTNLERLLTSGYPKYK